MDGEIKKYCINLIGENKFQLNFMVKIFLAATVNFTDRFEECS